MLRGDRIAAARWSCSSLALRDGQGMKFRRVACTTRWSMPFRASVDRARWVPLVLAQRLEPRAGDGLAAGQALVPLSS